MAGNNAPKSQRLRSAVTELNERFGLNPVQACEAIRHHHQSHGGANDNGTS